MCRCILVDYLICPVDIILAIKTLIKTIIGIKTRFFIERNISILVKNIIKTIHTYYRTAVIHAVYRITQNLVLHILVFRNVQWLIVLDRITEREGVAEAYLGLFIALTIFCLDDDHTVGTTRTVDGCGSSIFQHIDAFDVVRRNINERIDTSILHEGRHTVNHEKRLVVIALTRFWIRRSDTTDIQLEGRTRFTIGSCGQHTLHGTLKKSVDCRSRSSQFADLLLVYGRDGTGHILATLAAITNYYEVVESHMIQFKHHVLFFHTHEFDGFRLETDARIHDFRMRHGREFQDIIAVSIRDDAIAGAFNLDGNSYQRISFGINNTAFHKGVTFFLNFYNTHLFAHACRRGSMDCSH